MAPKAAADSEKHLVDRQQIFDHASAGATAQPSKASKFFTASGNPCKAAPELEIPKTG
jgi:hypothetical protein